MTDADDQRPPPRSWWVDALNPIENLRTLADIQQFGRRAAEDLADRLLTPDLPDGRQEPPRRSEAELDALMRRWRADSALAADLWSNLIEGAAAMISIVAARIPGVGPEAAPDRRDIELGPASPGDVASAVFWVHNSSATAVNDVRPHCSPPRSHQGEELGAEVVSFDPAVFDPLPARSSCGVEVKVAVPPTASPGTYATVVLVSNVPALYLPLNVAVVAAPPLA
jgi:hypothetical protein